MLKATSVIALKVWDKRKFSKKDGGYLGETIVLVVDILDLERGGDGIV